MRRFLLSFAAALALIACGQPQSNASAQAIPANAQADYLAACTAAMIAENPRAGEWAPAQCQQQWETVVAAGPMAEAILAAVPVSGATDPASLRARLAMVQWDARPEGTLIASGRLGRDLSVEVDRAGPNLNFYWSEAGAAIPYDVLGALRGARRRSGHGRLLCHGRGRKQRSIPGGSVWARAVRAQRLWPHGANS